MFWQRICASHCITFPLRGLLRCSELVNDRRRFAVTHLPMRIYTSNWHCRLLVNTPPYGAGLAFCQGIFVFMLQEEKEFVESGMLVLLHLTLCLFKCEHKNKYWLTHKHHSTATCQETNKFSCSTLTSDVPQNIVALLLVYMCLCHMLPALFTTTIHSFGVSA